MNCKRCNWETGELTSLFPVSPLAVTISNKLRKLLAGTDYNFSCLAQGYSPAVEFRWFLGDLNLPTSSFQQVPSINQHEVVSSPDHLTITWGTRERQAQRGCFRMFPIFFFFKYGSKLIKSTERKSKLISFCEKFDAFFSRNFVTGRVVRRRMCLCFSSGRRLLTTGRHWDVRPSTPPCLCNQYRTLWSWISTVSSPYLVTMTQFSGYNYQAFHLISLLHKHWSIFFLIPSGMGLKIFWKRKTFYVTFLVVLTVFSIFFFSFFSSRKFEVPGY